MRLPIILSSDYKSHERFEQTLTLLLKLSFYHPRNISFGFFLEIQILKITVLTKFRYMLMLDIKCLDLDQCILGLGPGTTNLFDEHEYFYNICELDRSSRSSSGHSSGHSSLAAGPSHGQHHPRHRQYLRTPTNQARS